METNNQDTVQVVFGQNSASPDLGKRLAKICQLAILRYNQAKSNTTETTNDDAVGTSIAVLTPNADTSSDEADC